MAVRPLGGVGGGLQPSDGRALGVALPSCALVARGRYFVPSDALCSSNFVGVDYFESSKRATALGATEEWAAKAEARRRAEAHEGRQHLAHRRHASPRQALELVERCPK